MAADSLLAALVSKANEQPEQFLVVQVGNIIVIGLPVNEAEFASALNLPLAATTSTSYIHLKDAKIHHDGKITAVAWWRGGVEDVTSFAVPAPG